MDSTTAMNGTDTRTSTPPHSTRRVLATWAALNAASAWYGTVGLLVGWLDFGTRLDRRLPFDSLVIAGLALAAIVAVPLSIVAWLAWTGDPSTGRASVATGMLLVSWIGLQLVFLQEFSWFQPVYALIGVTFIAAGLRPAPADG